MDAFEFLKRIYSMFAPARISVSLRATCALDSHSRAFSE